MIFSKEQLQELQNKIDIFEFYQQYLPDLSQRGRLCWARCCFHQEVKASFSVDIATGMWKCWGENIYGSIYSFYQKYFNLNFTEAVQQIAEKYDFKLEIDEETKKEREYIKSLKNINSTVNAKFVTNLERKNDAYNYLVNIRGLSPKIIRDFELGLGLSQLPEKESLKTLGLIKQGDNCWYATFRNNRITFPLKDEYGNIIGFQGRLWDSEDGPKYLYTSTTPLFKKNEYIYGLYEAKKYIKHFNSVVIVEGGIDMIKCHQKGIVNAVAMGGLNLSENNINKLKKYTNTFYIVVEDEAILRESHDQELKRNVSTLDKAYMRIKENIPYAKVYIIDLRNKDGSKCDPDDYLTTHTREDFKELIKTAPIYNEYIINSKLKKINPKNIEEQTACINYLLPKIEQISDFMTRRQYIELVSNKLSISENAIYSKLKYRSKKQNNLDTTDLKWDSKPVYAQKVLLSMCLAPNFNNLKTCGIVLFKAKQYMSEYYKNILDTYIAPYILKNKDEENISFKEFVNDILYSENIEDVVKDEIMNIYLKVEQLEDFDNEDIEELIDEQISTLKEYKITELDVNEMELQEV